MFLAMRGGAQSYLTNGLVAYFQFNRTVNDAAGNGINGTNNGSLFVADRFGITGGALHFTNSTVTTGFLPPLGGSARTISGWFNVASNQI
jgi:hypothetical protein